MELPLTYCAIAKTESFFSDRARNLLVSGAICRKMQERKIWLMSTVYRKQEHVFLCQESGMSPKHEMVFLSRFCKALSQVPYFHYINVSKDYLLKC